MASYRAKRGCYRVLSARDKEGHSAEIVVAVFSMANDNVGESTKRSIGAQFRDAIEQAYVRGETALDELLSLYDENVHFRDPVHDVQGRSAFAEMNRKFLRSVRSLEIDVVDLVEGERSFFVAWTMRLTPRVGPAVSVDGVTHVRHRDGKIVEQRDHFDMAGSALDALPGVGAAYRTIVGKLF